MLYKYTWTPVIKGTHSLIANLTLWELWLTWASEILLQVTPPGLKPTCIEWEEANWRDIGLHGKVTLVPNLSYLFFCRNNWRPTWGTRQTPLVPAFLWRWFLPAAKLELASKLTLVPLDPLASPLTWPPS